MKKEKRDLVKARDGYRCVKCKTKEHLTIDHIIPLDAGGTNELSNLRTLCFACNVMKSNLPSFFTRLWNTIFSSKSIYEFRNELRGQISTKVSYDQAKNLITEQQEQIKGLIKALTEKQKKHSEQIYLMSERIKGLQTYHKLEWRTEQSDLGFLEEKLTFKGYKKIK